VACLFFCGGGGLLNREIFYTLIVVVYREGAAEGFIITAFITSKIAALERKKQLWP